jgi:ceramide synthetase
MTAAEVNAYFWASRRNRAMNTRIKKFVEALWRFLFYTVFCLVGYQTLFVPSPVSWILNSDEFWNDWPMHGLTKSISFYYQVELGAYFHQLLWTEVSRSDAAEMIVHHFVTIFLVVLSYLLNFTRIGTAILLLHDSADVFLESAKVFNYISKSPGGDWSKVICDALFGAFAVTFFVTRLVFYPKHILYSVVVTAQQLFGFSPAYWIFTALLATLQVLHIFWFYLISRMLYVVLFSGGVDKDIRSDDDGMADTDAPEGVDKED